MLEIHWNSEHDRHCMNACCCTSCVRCKPLLSDLPVGRLCYYKVSEGGVSRNYFDKYKIKDVKDYILGLFLLQGHNCFYCLHGTKTATVPSLGSISITALIFGFGGTSHIRRGWRHRRLRFACVAHCFRDIQRVLLL